MCLLACLYVLSTFLTFIVADSEQSYRVLRRPQSTITGDLLRETDRLPKDDRSDEETPPILVPSALGKLYRETTAWDGRERRKLPFGSSTVISLHLREANECFRVNMPRLNESDTVTRIEFYFFHQPLLLFRNGANYPKSCRESTRTQLELYQRLTNGSSQEIFQLLGVQQVLYGRSGWLVFPLWPQSLQLDGGLNSKYFEFCLVLRGAKKHVITVIPWRTKRMGSLGHQYAPYILLYLRQAKHSGDFDDLFRAIPFSSDFSHFRHRQSLGISSPEINSWHSNFPRTRRKTVANLTLVHLATENQTLLKRVRRQARYRDVVGRSAFPRSRSHRMCSMQSMFVDFAQIGWNRWIISPTHYDARMCTGQCPFPLGQAFHPSNHAVVQMLMHHLNPSPTGPGTVRIHRPCCVPQKLAALHVLYHDQNNQVILKVYDDMIVESCGCR